MHQTNQMCSTAAREQHCPVLPFGLTAMPCTFWHPLFYCFAGGPVAGSRHRPPGAVSLKADVEDYSKAPRPAAAAPSTGAAPVSRPPWPRCPSLGTAEGEGTHIQNLVHPPPLRSGNAPAPYTPLFPQSRYTPRSGKAPAPLPPGKGSWSLGLLQAPRDQQQPPLLRVLPPGVKAPLAPAIPPSELRKVRDLLPAASPLCWCLQCVLYCTVLYCTAL